MYVQFFVSADYVIQKERNYHIYCTRLVWNEKRKICQARCKIANQNEEKFVWSDDRPFFGLGPLFDPLLCSGDLERAKLQWKRKGQRGGNDHTV